MRVYVSYEPTRPALDPMIEESYLGADSTKDTSMRLRLPRPTGGLVSWEAIACP
jgi:hypothetical protein